MDEYEQKAKDFLEKTNTTVDIITRGCSKPVWDKDNYHREYTIRLNREDDAFEFQFWDSINNTQKGIKPTVYSVLSSINYEHEAEETFESFCDAFGYSDDSINAKKIYENCQEHNTELAYLYTEEELELLSEVA